MVSPRPGVRGVFSLAPSLLRGFSWGMTSFVSHTSVDCSDAYTLSEFWRAVLGYVDDPDDPNEPGH